MNDNGNDFCCNGHRSRYNYSCWINLEIFKIQIKKIEDRFDKLDGKLDRKVSELYNYVDNLGEKVADHDKECDTDRAVIKERMENFKEHKEKLLRRVEVEDDE